MNELDFEEVSRDLTSIEPEADYYALTLLADEQGNIGWKTQSQWAGFLDAECKIEIREASTVVPHAMRNTWELFGESCVVANSEVGLCVYARLGGNALVKADIVKAHLPWLLEPGESVYVGLMRGFRSISGIPDHALKRSTRPRQRMRILKRDRFRCRICGRCPDDYTDIELHVHHIRPWSEGGLTEDGNLITLCDTCHDGLDPHGEESLLCLPGVFIDDSDSLVSTYYIGVERYRKAMSEKCKEVDEQG